MNNLAISVIIPTYNRADRLNRSLENYLQSDRFDIEFVVIDNHSDDNTHKVVDRFMRNDSRIRYIRNSSNIGVTRSLFRGFLNAKAPLIMILSDDDSITKNFINLVVEAFKDNPTVGIVHSSFHYPERNIFPKEGESRIYKKGIDALSFIYAYSGGIPGIAFRREAINFDTIKLDNSIYPQIRMSSYIALNYDVYFISSSNEYVTIGLEDNVIEKLKSRPFDYGVHERLNIALDVVKELPKGEQSFGLQHLTLTLLNWASSVFVEIYKEDEKCAYVYFRNLIKHPYINSSFIFWAAFSKICLLRTQVKILDKVIYCALMFAAIPVSLLTPNFYQSLKYIFISTIRKAKVKLCPSKLSW